MATLVTLTINARDIVGENFDPRHAAAFIVTNTEKGIVVVDGVEVQAGGRRQKFDLAGQVVFSNLVATNSASNPATFAYRVQLVWTSVGSREKENWTSSDFPLTTSKNLAAIPEAFDGLAISPTWQSDFRDEMEAIAGLTGEDAAIANRITTGGSLTDVALKAAYVASGARTKHAPALGLYFPEAEGALADGTTDDTTALAATLTLTRAAKGRMQLQPNKTYIVSATLNPAGTSIDGFGATLKQKAGVTAFPMLQATTGPLVVRDLTLDGNRANTTSPSSIDTQGSAIYIFRSAGGDAGLIQNVTAQNLWGSAVRIGSTRFTDPRDNNRTAGNIVGLRATGCGVGVFLDAARDVKISGSQFVNLDRIGVQDNYGCDNSVTASTVDGIVAGHGILTQYSYGFSAVGNSVRRTGTSMTIGSGIAATGIQVGGGDTAYNIAKGFTIANNVIEDCYHYGISIDPTLVGSPGVVQVSPGTISGNYVSNCGTRAFAEDPATNGGSGVFLHNASQIACTGNLSRSHQRAGIIDDGLDNTVSGNTLLGNLDYGVEVRCASGETKGRGTLGANAYVSNGLDVFVSQYSIAGDRALPGARSAYKTADQTVTNTTTTAFDNHLTFGRVVPGTYELSGMLVVDTSAVADFRAAWEVPAGTDIAWTLDSFNTSAASTVSPIFRAPVVATGVSGTQGVTTAGGIASGTLVTHLPAGTIKVTTSGVVQFRFAQGTAEATNTILKAGSYIRLTRIA